MYIGNYKILNPVADHENSIILVDVVVTMVFSEIIILLTSESMKEKMVMNVILLMQTVPLILNLTIFDASKQGFISAVITFVYLANIGTYVIFVMTSLYTRIKNKCVRLNVIIMTYAIMACIPTIIIFEMSRGKLAYEQLMMEFQNQCFHVPGQYDQIRYLLGMYIKDPAKHLLVSEYLNSSKVEEYAKLVDIQRQLTQGSFSNVFLEIYGPIMTIVSLYPIVALTCYLLMDQSQVKPRKVTRELLVVVFVTITSVGFWFYQPHVDALNTITWDQSFIYSGYWARGAEFTFNIWYSSKKIQHPLDQMPEPRLDWILDQLKGRISKLMSDHTGLMDCQLTPIKFEIIENFKEQYVTINRFYLDKNLWIFVFFPVIIFFQALTIL